MFLEVAVDPSRSVGEIINDWLLWINVAILVYWLVAMATAVVATKKAGYSGWLGVLVVAVPFVGPLIALVLAVLKWPLERERDRAVDALEKAGGSLEPQHAKGEIEAEPDEK